MLWLEKIKKTLGEIIEISLLLIAFGIVIEILFGEAVPIFGQIAVNLTELLRALGDKGLVGLIAAGIIFFLFYRTVGVPVTNSNKAQVKTARKRTGRRTKQASKT